VRRAAQIRSVLEEWNPEALTADGFDEALVGIAMRFGMEPVACYDYEKCLAVLQEQGMDEEGAREYFEFNTLGAWVGDGTPMFVQLFPAEEP
jgi:hypothetical protein